MLFVRLKTYTALFELWSTLNISMKFLHNSAIGLRFLRKFEKIA